jgi:hypothetical protein
MWWIVIGLAITITIGGVVVVIKIVKALNEFRS